MRIITNKAGVYFASVLSILIIIVFCAGCSEQPNAITVAPAPKITSIQPKFVEGDILAKTASSTDLFLLILKYDSIKDKYERAFINKKSDGSWFRSNDKSEFADRSQMEKLYPAKVGHVSSSSLILIETKTSTPITTSAPTSSMTTTVPTTSVTTTVPTTSVTTTTVPTTSVTTTTVPTISGVSPRQGAINDVLSLTINGQNFKEGVKVSFIKGSTEIVCTSPVSTDSTKILCNLDLKTSNGAVAGDWFVTVLNIDGLQSGTWTQKFLIIDTTGKPTFKKIVPDYGTAGTAISITALTGTNFQSGATVALMKADNPNITATNVNVQSSTLMTLTFNPPSNAVAGAWDVVITNPNGQYVNYANIFSLLVSPNPTSTTTPTDSQVITSISPTFTYGNDVALTIIGTNFQQGFTAKMTKSTSTSVVIVARSERWDSPTQLTAWFTIPQGSMGTWNVVVTNPDGTTRSLPNGFEVR